MRAVWNYSSPVGFVHPLNVEILEIKDSQLYVKVIGENSYRWVNKNQVDLRD